MEKVLRVEDRLKIIEDFINVNNDGRKRKLEWQKRKKLRLRIY